MRKGVLGAYENSKDPNQSGSDSIQPPEPSEIANLKLIDAEDNWEASPNSAF